MFCTSCGQPNNSGVAFCAHCGAKVITPPTKAKVAASPIDAVAIAPKSETQRPTILWVSIGLIGAGLVLCFIPYAAWLGWALVIAGVVCAQVVFSKYPAERSRGLNQTVLALGYTGAALLLVVSFVSTLRVPSFEEVGKSILAREAYSDIHCTVVPTMAIVETFQPDVVFNCIMTDAKGNLNTGSVVEVHYNWYTGYFEWFGGS